MSGSIEDIDVGVDVDELPPSCKFVLHVLVEEREIRRQDLLARTTLPESTIDDAIRTLENQGFLTVERDSEDLRQVVAVFAAE